MSTISGITPSTSFAASTAALSPFAATRGLPPSDTRPPRETEDAASTDALSDAERREVEELAKRDREVRVHEQAHAAAAGPLFRGGPYYSYTQGPDGKRYVTGGKVNIDTGEARTPEETIQKAARVRAAAMAPAEPSSQDKQVAAAASQMEAQARAELAQAQTEGEDESTPLDPAQTESNSDANATTEADRGSAFDPGSESDAESGSEPTGFSRALVPGIVIDTYA